MKQMLWIAITLVSAACVAQIETAAVDTLRITLPSEAIAVGSQVRLSEVASLDGASVLIEKAGDLTLGTFISKRRVIQIDRNTIRSRLAGLGIDGSRVEFNGAQSVSVKRKECVLDSNTIAQAAKTYLEKQVADKKIASLSLFRSPTPMVFEPISALDACANMRDDGTTVSRNINWITIHISPPAADDADHTFLSF